MAGLLVYLGLTVSGGPDAPSVFFSALTIAGKRPTKIKLANIFRASSGNSPGYCRKILYRENAPKIMRLLITISILLPNDKNFSPSQLVGRESEAHPAFRDTLPEHSAEPSTLFPMAPGTRENRES